jgi:GNAT superfamily N-acetyltransferase
MAGWLNLAAWRYRRVMESAGGPIGRLRLAELAGSSERRFQANANLRPGLVPARSTAVFGEADGTGTDTRPMVARFKAISEALERWAFYAVSAGPLAGRYGFAADPSSNGMAAFPGLAARQARRPALREAIERFCLIGWWEGGLSHHAYSSPGLAADAVLLEGGERLGISVAVVHRCQPDGAHAYGFAAGATAEEACARAMVELERHGRAVASYLLHTGRGVSSVSTAEYRALRFASDEGYGRFMDRVNRGPWQPAPEMRMVYDGPVPGPWSRWTSVWRVALQPSSRRFLSPDSGYFLW